MGRVERPSASTGTPCLLVADVHARGACRRAASESLAADQRQRPQQEPRCARQAARAQQELHREDVKDRAAAHALGAPQRRVVRSVWREDDGEHI
jgi:hypothetical protein